MERVHEYDRQLQIICQEHSPETELLRQVEGIGALTALTLVLSLEYPYRCLLCSRWLWAW